MFFSGKYKFRQWGVHWKYPKEEAVRADTWQPQPVGTYLKIQAMGLLWGGFLGPLACWGCPLILHFREAYTGPQEGTQQVEMGVGSVGKVSTIDLGVWITQQGPLSQCMFTMGNWVVCTT